MTETILQEPFVEPHKLISREVHDEDTLTLLTLKDQMTKLCWREDSLGRVYPSAFALAHSQVEKKDPMRFFVFSNGDVVINPVITNHTKVPQFKPERCVSFPRRPEVMVPRYTKIEVLYQTLTRDTHTIGPEISASYSGLEARVWQHEVDHMNGKSIYDYQEK
jgi:peptide deformylase